MKRIQYEWYNSNPNSWRTENVVNIQRDERETKAMILLVRRRSQQTQTQNQQQQRLSTGISPHSFHPKQHGHRSPFVNKILYNAHIRCERQKLELLGDRKLFPLQNLAIEYFHSQRQPKRKLPKTGIHPIPDNNPQHLSSSSSVLYSNEPRIFALETSKTGKRKYIVSSLGRFMHHYWREREASSRHVYELIMEGYPCRLYFDLEFCKKSNPHIDSTTSNQLLNEFIQELIYEIYQTYNITIHPSNIIDLDSSTDSKFSHHFILHLYSNHHHHPQQQQQDYYYHQSPPQPSQEFLFANNIECGLFVKTFVGRLAQDVSTGVLKSRSRFTLAKCLFVNTKYQESTNDSAATSSCGDNGIMNNATSSLSSMTPTTTDKDETCTVTDVLNDTKTAIITTVENNTPIHSKSTIPNTQLPLPSSFLSTTAPSFQKTTTCFIDTGVYTRNRLFRILGSKKYGKPNDAILRISPMNEFPFPKKPTSSTVNGLESAYTCTRNDLDGKKDSLHDLASILSQTFIIPLENEIRKATILPSLSSKVEPNHSLFTSNNNSTLNISNNSVATCRQKHIVSSSTNNINTTTFPFPKLYDFVDHKLAKRQSLYGSIRSWSISYDTPNIKTDFMNDTINGNNTSSMTNKIDPMLLQHCTISFLMKDNRWCEYVGRAHKSNNILWIVSIPRMEYWQSCFDPECRRNEVMSRQQIYELDDDIKMDIWDVLASLIHEDNTIHDHERDDFSFSTKSNREEDVSSSLSEFESAYCCECSINTGECHNQHSQKEQMNNGNQTNEKSNEELDKYLENDETFNQALMSCINDGV